MTQQTGGEQGNQQANNEVDAEWLKGKIGTLETGLANLGTSLNKLLEAGNKSGENSSSSPPPQSPQIDVQVRQGQQSANQQGNQQQQQQSQQPPKTFMGVRIINRSKAS